MWKNFTIVLTAMLVLQLCFQVSVLFADNNSSWRITFQRSASHEKTGHTIPTLLSVVDDATGEYIYALDNPLYEALKTSKFVTIHNETEEYMSKVQLQLDRKTIRPRENVTVSWSHQSDLVNDDDILLLYCGDHTKYADINFHQFLDAATILQARATSNKHFITTAEKYQHRNQWYFPSFPVVGYNACRFGLFQNRLVSNNAIKLVALSTVLHIGNGTELPSELHLALGDTIDTMMVQFQTGAKGAPVVRYGMSPDALLLSATGSSHTYTAQDMCQKPATQVEPGKFQPPGFLHQVTLTHLEPNRTYHYQVGLKEDSGKTTWSATISRFVSAPKVEVDAEPFSFVVYGDQGCPSDGWGQGGTWTAAMTTREVDGVSNNNPIRMVHHMGDLSYAKGAAHIWDEWFNMIEPFASRVPLLVAVGNHEYDHTKGGEYGKDPSGVQSPGGYKPAWGNFHKDSHGECGVPTANRFAMPKSIGSNGVFWYSFDFANLHTTVISSEHDLSPGSRQYQWLEADLKAVDRSRTPWLILELHRSMYESEADPLNSIVSVQTRHRVEPLLKKYNVDLVLSAHYHSYLRTCANLYDGKCNTAGGQTHITVGTSGAQLRKGHLYPHSHWTSKFIKGTYGYGRITVYSATALHFEFVQAGSQEDADAGRVLDNVWLRKDKAAFGSVGEGNTKVSQVSL